MSIILRGTLNTFFSDYSNGKRSLYLKLETILSALSSINLAKAFSMIGLSSLIKEWKFALIAVLTTWPEKAKEVIIKANSGINEYIKPRC